MLPCVGDKEKVSVFSIEAIFSKFSVPWLTKYTDVEASTREDYLYLILYQTELRCRILISREV